MSVGWTVIFLVFATISVVAFVLSILAFMNRVPDRPDEEKQWFLTGNRKQGVEWTNQVALAPSGDLHVNHNRLSASNANKIVSNIYIFSKTADRQTKIGEMVWYLVRHALDENTRLCKGWGIMQTPISLFAPGTGCHLRVEFPTQVVVGTEFCVVQELKGIVRQEKEVIHAKLLNDELDKQYLTFVTEDENEFDLQIVRLLCSSRISVSYVEHVHKC